MSMPRPAEASRYTVGRFAQRLAAVAFALLLVPATGFAQGRMINAKSETRSAAQGLAAAVSAEAALGGAEWVGYAAPMEGGRRQMCCYDSFSDGTACCSRCRLESGSGASTNTGSSGAGGGRIMLEPPMEFFVLARLEAGKVVRVRTFTPDCEVDAGGMTVVWLTDVKPDQSVAWLSSVAAAASHESERTDRVTSSALAALAVHAGPESVRALVRFAREDESTRLRGQALFWLAQKAGEQAIATITGAIDNDPETDVKKKAVFALSQLPKDEGVPLLIQVAKTNRNPEVRKQAMFWLGQTHDPRAVTFFEEILSRK